ncbi:hypothetical protein PUNSTDRAFT_110361 [Punctularia strigosozonata HHB-11173 SS5]|uniref:uncharacterized protein n=1 Tax=Punctularia strigosozonata (strain HHB-11173) TaxID=741275 RepID=UPI000441674F|nr:uncharacterized protein PUNSTDRAFT_110361 [Punctularia strigosozonata HHB-11173 SS5]EIN14240.1 hypothetical protein PUNSTDRAFT_110361 [Punctularia strigosozonata HHB-11173 SS5]
MQSLRQRKTPERGEPSRSARPAKRDASARKSRVDDKIKKRMSMRYADISAPTGGQGIPEVPSMPMGYAPTRSTSPEQDGEGDLRVGKGRRAEEQKAAEMKMLDEKNFDPDAYLKLKLANSTEAELKSLQSSLQNTKDETNADLQRNVFKNYAEFVHISKEISTLENEMLELKDSLSEWRNMPSLLHIDENASVAERRRNVRSSVADLRVLYASQMQSLHAQIEGSTKFVPTIPGRHVVSEMEDGILALNAATYKVTHAVRFVLLDDAVLVAKRKKGRDGGSKEGGTERGGKWVAERCWPLNEMLVLDTKDTASMTNVFKIRHGKETHVYRTEVAADKKALLAQFRHIADELATKRRKEREGEHERRKTMWGGADDRSASDWMAELARNAGMSDTAKEKAERDARWLSDYSDGLTVAIALRDWDKAAALVEEGETKLPTIPSLSAKLPTLTASLTSALLTSLASPTIRKSEAVRLIALLVRLHAGPAARSTFLNARAEVMRKRVRSIRFEGSVEMYVNELAVVVFTGLKHTADWFLASFKENEVASGFVEWAKHQMEAFAELFRRQVYTSDAPPQIVSEARRIAFVQSKKLLEEYGLDFRYLLEDLLSEHPKDQKEVIRPPMPVVKRHSPPRSGPVRTPAPTPIRVRSPEPRARSNGEASSTPPRSSPLASTAPLPKVVAPSPVRSPVQAPRPPRAPSPSLSVSSASSESRTPRIRSPVPPMPRDRSALGADGPAVPTTRPVLRPQRAAARSRPGSAASDGSSAGYRPPPVAVPRREGMF